MLDRIIKIKNGDRLVDFRIYKCDKCGREIKECWPHACHRRVHKNKDGKWLYSEKKKGCG